MMDYRGLKIESLKSKFGEYLSTLKIEAKIAIRLSPSKRVKYFYLYLIYAQE